MFDSKFETDYGFIDCSLDKLSPRLQFTTLSKRLRHQMSHNVKKFNCYYWRNSLQNSWGTEMNLSLLKKSKKVQNTPTFFLLGELIKRVHYLVSILISYLPLSAYFLNDFSKSVQNGAFWTFYWFFKFGNFGKINFVGVLTKFSKLVLELFRKRLRYNIVY